MDTGNPIVIRIATALATLLFFGAIWLLTVAFLRVKKKKNAVYLLFFTIFYVYLYKVLDYTQLQFQSLLLLKHFVPGIMLRGQQTAGHSVNLIPLAGLTSHDIKTSLLNILLLVPFGFGLPFITSWSLGRVVISAAVFSIMLELMQLATGLLSEMTFRIVDINDVLFNTLGAAVGYLLFKIFMCIYRRIHPGGGTSPNPVLRYIAERPQSKQLQS